MCFFLLIYKYFFFCRYGPDADAKFHPANADAQKEIEAHHLEVNDGDSHKALYPCKFKSFKNSQNSIVWKIIFGGFKQLKNYEVILMYVWRNTPSHSELTP